MRRLLLAVLLILALSCPLNADIWARGNLHTHTTNSDGDSDPQVVADWYRENGYQFLVISDHWHITDYSDIDAGKDFILIPGDETGVTGHKVVIHMNSIGTTKPSGGAKARATVARSIETLVGNIRAVGGIPMVNHPNFRWSFGHRELLGVDGPYLLEIYNGAGGSNNPGNNAFLPVEQTWDILLSNGKTVYSTATDDAHVFKRFRPASANPGRGWVYVRVPELTSEAVLNSLAGGDFYSSTGVKLSEVKFKGSTLSVKIKADSERKYLIRFQGKWGSILQETEGVSASFTADLTERNSYVRCKVISDDGTVAWTQAFRRTP